MPGYDGFAALGDAIVGGPRRRAEAEYPKRMKQNFDAFDALNQARISRAQANARERLTADVVTRALSGDPTALGDLGATTMSMASGQPNFSTFTGGMKDLGDIELQRQQVAAAEAGDTDRLNRLTAVAGDKLLEQTKISGGMAYNPLGTPDQAIVVTPLGEATIGHKQALGEAAMTRAGAAANASNARAGLYETQTAAGGWKPGSGKAAPTKSDQEAKLAFLQAEATRLAEERGNEWAEAWLNKEIAKLGFEVTPITRPERGPDFQNVADFSSTVPALGEGAGTAVAPDPLVAQARQAIARGADPEAVRRRLREMGRSDLAGSL